MSHPSGIMRPPQGSVQRRPLAAIPRLKFGRILATVKGRGAATRLQESTPTAIQHPSKSEVRRARSCARFRFHRADLQP
jgi:hypothetical protein